ncbi:hypothetical protein H6X84_24245, partial [Salmonella enterica subsp. enterica serovar Enteritidis]|uniref:hypothetical protein n=1 Tax=Salmonella enterica TaxID=28901 RepID=UPI0017F5D22C
MDNKSTNGFSASINGLSSHWETQTLDNPTLLSIKKELRIDSTKSTTTDKEDIESESSVMETYTKVFNQIVMPSLFSEYIRKLKAEGHTDEFITESMLEAGESGSKPSLRFLQTICDRWIKDGIKSREESKAHRDKSKSVVQPKRLYNKPVGKQEIPI